MKKKRLKRKVKEGVSDKLLKDIANDFGSLSFLSDEEQLFILPTIFPSFNRASHIGGLPGGCIIELHGPNQGGKTALGVAFLVSAQRRGHIVGIKDYEGSFKDKKWPKSLGLKLDSCLYSAPDTFEEGADNLNEIIIDFKKKQTSDSKYKNKMMFWLVDSVNAMVPEAEMLGKIGKRNFGLQALLLSRWLRKLNSIIKGSNVSVIFVSQERANIGAQLFQKKWKTASGEALKFYAHFRARVLRSSQTKVGDMIVGKEHRFVVEKNKVSAPDEIGYFFTSNGKYPEICPLGFDMARMYFREGIEQGIIRRKKKKKEKEEEKSSKKWTCDFDDDAEKGLTEKKFLEKLKTESDFMEWMESEFEKGIEVAQS